MLTGARRTGDGAPPTRTAPACGNGRAGLVSLGNASGRETAHRPGVLACYAAQLHLYIWGVTAYRLAMLTFSPVAAAAHAAGIARRPILPGETMPPPAPSHGAAAPELPSIAAAFAAENTRLRAIGDRATASAFARLASMRATIDAELARDC